MNIDEYKNSKVEIGKTTFVIDKLNANAGFKVLEILRVAIIASGESFQTAGNDFMNMCKGVLGLPIDIVESVKTELFNNIRFFKEKNETKGKGIYLQRQCYDMAFEGLEPIDMYDLLLRALVVNFFSSFQKLKSKIPQLQSLIELDPSK
ncbi:MAG: hypothetical protein V3V61_01290 [Gammaproteobacteria bacterium]